MSVIQHLWRGRRVRVAGAVEQVAVDRFDDMAGIYQQYWELVYRRCLATLGDDQAAEDATQDVFLLALLNFEQVQHDVVRGLLDIARTISYERRRRPAREVSLADPAQHRNGGDDPAEIAERHGVLDAVWSGLSPVERRYVADKFAGFSFEEIAQRNRRKLGTVSSNLFRAREHARNLRGPTLPALLGVAGWRRLTDLARRARNSAHAASTAAAAQPVQTLTVSLTLAGLLAGLTPAVSPGSSPHPGAAGPTAVVPPTQLASGAPAQVAAAGGVSADHPGKAVAYSATPRSASGGVSPNLPLTSPASAETPEDTVIYTATPSPNYDNDHTILAIGRGNACACSVLLRSTDGGASWEARDGAPDGDQIALPPDYPRDPTIFIGNGPGSSGTSDWWAPSFDGSFVILPVPAGAIALPAGYDSGDARVIVSASSGVWSYDTRTRVLQPLVVETQGSVAPGLATPLGAVQTGVLALTSSQAISPGTVGQSTMARPDSMTLWACPPGSGCSPDASLPLRGGALAAAPDFSADPALVAYAPLQAVVSPDAGKTFRPLALPAGTSSFDAVSLGMGSAGASLWVVAQRGNTVVLEFSPTLDGSWNEVDHGLPQITAQVGRVVTLGAHRAMYLAGNGGFVCTNDDGAHWTPRCPAA